MPFKLKFIGALLSLLLSFSYELAQAQNSKISQPISDTVYYHTYGGFNLDEARDFKETSEKGFIIAGTSSSFGDGSTSFYLVKTDSNGTYQWSKTYGSTNNDWCKSIEKTKDNGYLLCGYSNSYSNFDYDGFIVKVDSNGNALWQKTIGETDWDFFYGSCATSDSGFVFSGETYSSTAGGTDAYICKIDRNGDTLWTRKFGTPFDESFSDVIEAGSSIFACGKIYSSDSSKIMALLVKYDQNGNCLDTLLYGNESSHNFKFNFVNKISNDNLLVGGEKVMFSGSNPASSLLMKLDTSMNFIWDTYAGYQSQKDCMFGFENSLNEIVALHQQDGSVGGKASYIYQLTSNSNFVDGATQDYPGNDFLYKGILTSGNRLAFVGHTSSFGAGSSDFWLVIFKKDSIYDDTKIKIINFQDTLPLSLISIEESIKNTGISFFPNPVGMGEKINITGIAAHTELKIISMLGQEVFRKKIETQQSEILEFYLPVLNKGNYLLLLNGEKTSYRFKLMVN